MKEYRISDHLVLKQPDLLYAEELFQVVDANRSYLGQWLPWVPKTKALKDVVAFIDRTREEALKGEALTYIIFDRTEVAGVVSYNKIDQINGVGTIGYWLAEKYNGKGIMTQSVKSLIDIGKEHYALQKIEIRCAVGNDKSRSVAERLGFEHEGTLRSVEKINDGYLDHLVYGIVLET